jgi:hypothetical protein
VVTVSVLHSRSDYSMDTKFMNNCLVKNDSELDLKTIFCEAFSKAHPDWSILEIKLCYDV